MFLFTLPHLFFKATESWQHARAHCAHCLCFEILLLNGDGRRVFAVQCSHPNLRMWSFWAWAFQNDPESPVPIWNVKLMIVTASTCQKHKKTWPKRSLHLESLQLFFFSTVAAWHSFVFFVDDGALTQTWGEKLKFFMGFPSEQTGTLLGSHISPTKIYQAICEDDFPFPVWWDMSVPGGYWHMLLAVKPLF